MIVSAFGDGEETFSFLLDKYDVEDGEATEDERNGETNEDGDTVEDGDAVEDGGGDFKSFSKATSCLHPIVKLTELAKESKISNLFFITVCLHYLLCKIYCAKIMATILNLTKVY
ncbi:hypothetical protein ABRG53_3162 [Pseudanabaena sp. ABRG5-3]|nr:hypothetical protein ABRG53_3162 [Pseudanabaena sp. ABRG5-3]